MNSRNCIASVSSIAAALLLVVLAAPGDAAEKPCCFNNFRFAGGCMVVPSGSETCQSILTYLNSFDSVGRGYCGNTTVRGGWSLTPCSSAIDNQPQTYSPQTQQPSQPVRQQQPSARPIQPPSAPAASEANLLQVSMPLAVRLDDGLDPSSVAAGQVVTGTLEQDLRQGDDLIAPAGSRVTARVVPTSYWNDAGGDAFQLQATEIRTDDSVMPVATGLSASLDPGTGAVLTFASENTHAAPNAAASSESLLHNTWMAAFNSRDPEALAAMYAEDAVLLPPDAPAVFGRDAIRASFADVFAANDLKVEIEALETVIEGSLAYVAGRYRMWTGEGQLVDRGKYLEIWRVRDGKWLIHRDIHNSSLPTGAKAGSEER
jgi:uncharacterized protein (TIGR02246 family)